MSEAPQLHCDHECVCFLIPEIEERIPGEICSAKNCEHDTRSRPVSSAAAPAPEPVIIRLREPLRDLPSGESAVWQTGYRERLLKQIVDARNIPKEKWYEYFKSISTTCPDCFCPNLEEHYAEISNSKGFHCPACGNSFDLPIVPFSLIDSTAIAKQERERVLEYLQKHVDCCTSSPNLRDCDECSLLESDRTYGAKCIIESLRQGAQP